MVRDIHDHGGRINRRNILRAGAAGIAVGLSGCLGDDDDDDDDVADGDDVPGDDDDGDDDDVEIIIHDSLNPAEPHGGNWGSPEDAQYNIFNPANNEPMHDRCSPVYEQPAIYIPARDDFEPYLLDSWERDGDTVTAQISDEYTWHNGDPVTAEDMVYQYQLEMWRDHANGHRSLTDAEATDDYEFELTLRDPDQNEQLTYLDIFAGRDNRLAAHPDTHGEFYERYEDATTDDEMDEVTGDMVTHRVEEALGNGFMQYVERSDSAIHFEPFEDHPLTDEINWESYQVTYELTDPRENWYGEYCNLHMFPGTCMRTEEVSRLWELAVEVPQSEDGNGIVLFNHGRPVTGETQFRKALQWLIDPWSIVANTNLCSSEWSGVLTGVNDVYTEASVDPDALDDFTTFGQDLDQAEAELEEGPFEKVDGRWHHDGEEIVVEYITDDSSFELGVGQTLQSLLDEIGVTLELTTLEDAAWDARLVDSDYDISVTQHWFNHPYTQMNDLLNGFVADSMQLPDEWEVPPVGDPDGTPETWNVSQMASDLVTLEGDAFVEGMTELAWFVNQHVPVIEAANQWLPGFVYRPDLWDWDGSRAGVEIDEDILEADWWYTVPREGGLIWDPVDSSTLEPGHPQYDDLR